MKRGLFAIGLVILTTSSVVSVPASARDGELNVTIGTPGYYQPSYEQRGYRSQPDWEQEREARRQRAMEWRDHRNDGRDSHQDRDRHDMQRNQHDGQERGNGDRRDRQENSR